MQRRQQRRQEDVEPGVEVPKHVAERHLTTSDTVVLLGRPDGRLGTLAAAEAATIMPPARAEAVEPKGFLRRVRCKVGRTVHE